jgi:hypothetical protein
MFTDRDKENITVWHSLKDNTIILSQRDKPDTLKFYVQLMKPERRVQGVVLKNLFFLYRDADNILWQEF